MTYRIIQGSGQNVAFANSGGASAQSTAFGSQTRAIRISVAAAYSTTTTGGVHIEVGDNPTATTASPVLPANWVDYLIVSPGQKVAALGADASATGNLNISECTA